MKNHSRRYGYYLAWCFGLLWALLALVQSAHAGDVGDPGNATISGVVINAQGHPVQDIYVSSYLKTGKPDNPSLQPTGAVTTDSNGTYTITNLFSGTYQLSFDDTRLPPFYVSEMYNNVFAWKDASDILVGAGATVTGINATIGVPGQISGTVTNGAGEPIAGLFVVPFPLPVSEGEQFNAAITDSSGKYTVTKLPPGTYGLYFEALPPLPYQSEYYSNVYNLPSAQAITVAVDTTTANIDAQLGKLGHIQGTVTDETGNSLPNIQVSVAYSNTELDFWQPFNDSITSADGSYDVEALLPGLYRLGFVDPHNPKRYTDEYYNDSATLESATDILVAVDSVVRGINASLTAIDTPGAVISGTVTGTANNPLGLIHVLAYRVEDATPESNTWPVAGDDFTNAQGRYKLIGLPPGTYRVEFRDDALTPRFATEFYDNALTIAQATNIPVAENAVVDNINTQLGGRGSISGMVTDLVGNAPVPPDSVFVMLSQDPTGAGQLNFLYGVGLSASGAYSFPDLNPGIYHVGFTNATGYSHVYNLEYYDNASDFSLATPLVVAPDTHLTGIDAHLGPQGRIYGKVTDSDGNPLENIPVNLYYFDLGIHGGSWQPQGTLYSEADGAYRWGSLRYGAYRLHFAGSSAYVPEFYQDTTTLETATTLTLTKASPYLTDIDAQLSEFGRIHGTVKDESGNPIENIGVAVFSDPAQNGGWQTHLASGVTDSTGSYTLLGLEAGLYRLYFSDREVVHRYSGEYYDNASTLKAATTITVTSANTTTVDSTLAPPGGIRGKVTDPAGNPLSTVQVSLLTDQDDNGQWEGGNYFTSPDASGVYTFTGLDVGSYRLYFQDHVTLLYAPEFYSDSLTLDGATNVTVTAGIITPDINAQMGNYSHITGMVTDDAGNSLPNTYVTAYTWRADVYGNFDWQEVNNQSTNEQGQYNMSGLVTGVYRMRFADTYNNLLHTEYYDDAGYVYTAADITLGVAMTVTNINAQLSPFDAVNYPPLARNDDAAVIEGSVTYAAQFGDSSLLANDRDAEFLPITPTLVTSPTHGVVTLTAMGLFTYTHNGDGATIDYFTYKVNDGVHDSNVATVTVAITQTNDAPLAVADSFTLTAGPVLTGSNVLVNDRDEESTVLTATLVTTPTHGTLTLAASGYFTYTYDGSAALTDTFTYVASDGMTVSQVATVSLFISPTTSLVSFSFSKTVGIEGILPLCTAKGAMKVPVGTAVVYCYTIHNTGGVTLTTHSLSDSDLGRILNNVAYTLTPGASYSTTVTKSLTISITNVATWTATLDGGVQPNLRSASGVVGAASTAATVLISGSTDDQDGDTIPDNLESWADPDHDNLPNFLDTDSDGDLFSDQTEVGDPAHPVDSDNDGVPDFLDNDLSTPALNLHLYLPVIYK